MRTGEWPLLWLRYWTLANCDFRIWAADARPAALNGGTLIIADFIRLICENLRSEAKRLYLRPDKSPGQIRQTPVR
jgi:hypothetical protein